MPRGGKRKGAGRKALWNSGKTKAVKLPESLIPEIVEFAKVIDSALIDGSYGQEKVEDLERLVDILFDEVNDSNILEKFAQKLLSIRTNSVARGKLGRVRVSAAQEEDEHFGDLSYSTNERDVVEEMSKLPRRAIAVEEIDDCTQRLTFDAETGVSLTADQSAALEKMKQFIHTPRQKYFRLTGYAGTGKSYLIVQLMKWLLNQKTNFVAGSPTNKAVKNLKKLAAEAKVSVEAHTVAQLLGQQPELNEATGKEEFITQGTDSIGGYQVALIDEFSMISKSNFKDINQAVWHTPTKIIFVGDEAQLPPVGESEPVIATHEYIQNEATLSSIVRYDGDIAKVAEEIRSDHIFNSSLYPFQTTPDKTITCLNRDDWLKSAIAYFKSDSYIENPDHVRFLVWRNKTAASLNDYVRSQLWGEDVPNYVPGDRLIAKIPVFRRVPGGRGKNKWQIVMNNSEECEITGDAILKISKPTKWEYWLVPAKTDDGLKLDLRILTPESEQLRQEHMQELREKKRWRQYYDTLKSFDNLPYAYAITTHKAQGSSINYIFPDIADMRPCPDLQKILYTALTRARIQAFIPQ